MEEDRIVALIMAGGGGTRFWPRSRRSRPKQFLSFDGDASLMALSVQRLEGLVKPEQTLVITGKDHVDLARRETGLPEASVIGEPCPRDTAACIGYGLLLAREVREDAVMVVLPADHLISPTDRFQEVISRAADIAGSSDALVTVGLRPHRPATGYGYIETGDAYDSDRPVARKVIRFREKPDKETARRFVLAGRFLWNSGMLVFRTDTMLAALEEHLPELHSGLMDIDDPRDEQTVARVYEGLPSISIDFGVLERAKDKVVVEADFEWDDVGTFEAVARRSKKDESGNIAHGQAAFVDCKGNLVENAEEGLVVVSGVSDVLVVRTKDAVLVIPRDSAEQVKDVVRRLQEEGYEAWL